MSAIDILLRQPAIEAVGWALLQFVWQGALVGVLTALALLALRRSAADVRYVVASIGLTLMLTMPVMTGVQTWRSLSDDGARTLRAASSGAASGAATSGMDRGSVRAAHASISSQPTAASVPDRASSPSLTIEREGPRAAWSAIAVVVWLGGVIALSLRLLMGWLLVRRMTSHGTSPAPDEWQATLLKLSRRLHIARPILMLRSALVDVPTVIGWLRPVVLMPASALAGLAPHQLEAILAHELAHIRRHDYIVNLLQTLVETLLFYHPAVWWLSHRIRIERENCCDDLAVGLCGDPYAYARALADLEQLRAEGSRFALAANGGSLLHRVRRLLGAPSHAGRGPGWLAGSAAVLVIAGIAAGAVGRNVLLAEQSVATAAPIAATRPATVASPVAVEAAIPVASRQPRGAAPVEGAVILAAPAQQPSEAPVLDLTRLVASIVEDLIEQFGFTPAPPAPPVPPAPPAPPTPPTPATPVTLPTPPTPPTAPTPPTQATPATPPTPPTPPTAPTPPTPPTPALLLTPPMPPAAPAPPVPPAPPAAPLFEGRFVQGERSRATHTMSDGSRKLEISYDGSIEFTDDDTDVKSLSPGGYLRVRDSGWFGSNRTVEWRADASGALTRRYWEGSAEKPFEPGGRQWLADFMPRFIRQTGIGAARRVARIYASKGTGGVLAEISLVEGSWAKRIYFSELLKTGKLDAAAVRQILTQAGKEIDSDFELASLLISATDRLLDDGTRRAYIDAAKTIDSDFEMRRVYSAALKQAAVTPDVMAAILEASNAIGSSFEHASLLVQAAELQAIEGPVRAPFFRAAAAIESAFERGRVLQAVAKRSNLSNETVLAILRSAQTMGSNFETGQVLRAVAANHDISGEARTVYVDTASRLGTFEEGRALAALVKSEQRK